MKRGSLPRWGFVLIAALMLTGGLAINGVRPQPVEAVVDSLPALCRASVLAAVRVD